MLQFNHIAIILPLPQKVGFNMIKKKLLTFEEIVLVLLGMIYKLYTKVIQRKSNLKKASNLQNNYFVGLINKYV